MREMGTVIETTHYSARVLLQSCEMCKTCAAGYLCRPSGNDRIIEAENTIDAHIGDEVCIEISSRIGFLALFLLFGLPIILGVTGLCIGAQQSDTHALAYGIVGLVCGLIIAKIVNNILSKHQKLLPRIIEIVHPKGA
jgi:positive regulator of sigma E activity